jgi:hypothetical protein
LFRRSRFIYPALILFTVSTALAADFSGPVVSVLDGDTIEVLHNNRTERIRLPQSQRHPKERRNPLNHKNGEAHILECHQLGLLVPKIRPASPQNTANKKAKTSIGSMITS